MGVKTGKTNALKQIKCVCYAHVCVSLPSPPPHLLLTTAFAPPPPLSPPQSLPQARESPEDRLGQVAQSRQNEILKSVETVEDRLR
jgi:hypothetical protein